MSQSSVQNKNKQSMRLQPSRIIFQSLTHIRGPKKQYPPNTRGGVQNSSKINVWRVPFFGTPADTFSWRQKQPKGTPQDHPRTRRDSRSAPRAPRSPRSPRKLPSHQGMQGTRWREILPKQASFDELLTRNLVIRREIS